MLISLLDIPRPCGLGDSSLEAKPAVNLQVFAVFQQSPPSGLDYFASLLIVIDGTNSLLERSFITLLHLTPGQRKKGGNVLFTGSTAEGRSRTTLSANQRVTRKYLSSQERAQSKSRTGGREYGWHNQVRLSIENRKIADMASDRPMTPIAPLPATGTDQGPRFLRRQLDLHATMAGSRFNDFSAGNLISFSFSCKCDSIEYCHGSLLRFLGWQRYHQNIAVLPLS